MGKPKIVASYKMGGSTARITAPTVRDANAKCTYTGPGQRSCGCNEHYEGTGRQCRQVDYCQINHGNCSDDAACTPSLGETSCACNPGFSGDGKDCEEIDNCLYDNGGCDDNAKCTKTGPGANTCKCKTKFSGDGKSCENIACGKGNYWTGAACAPTPEQRASRRLPKRQPFRRLRLRRLGRRRPPARSRPR